GFGPAGGGQLVPPPTNALVPPAGNDLKAYLAETPKTSSSAAGLLVPPPADGGDEILNTLPPISPVPKLPAITPAPQIAASPQFEPPAITPGVAATQQPSLQAPALDLTPVAPAAPANAKGWNGTARPGGTDALTLTPAPVDKPAAIVEAPPAVTQQTAPAVSAPAAEVMQQELADALPEPDMSKPYTGLALEEDMFQPPIPVSGTTPTLQEPATIVDTATQSTSEPVIAANTNPVTLPAPPVEPEQVPELPPIGESTVTIETNGAGTVEIPATTTDTAAPALQTPPPLVLAPGLPAVPQATPQQQAPVVTAPTTQQAAAPKDEREEKMALIRSRTGMSGLKGFCAVALRDDRELLDTNEEFSALFNGKLYSFSSEENLERFLQEPVRYAPASRGNDVIHLALTGEEVEGSLDHAVWYQGRLYLFTSVETLETFTAAPSSHAVYE
ncbi:MAG: hypothetical protein KDA69_10450, partial [Planctomycetaceae bacterium]|nr:hypothetical protein [Planctomycetaceae bacterium]